MSNVIVKLTMLPEVNIRDALIQLFISDPIPVLSKQTLLLTVKLGSILYF